MLFMASKSVMWLCRETIFEALQWWNGRPPSDGLLLGFCILFGWVQLFTNTCASLLTCDVGKEMHVLVIATGVLFTLMQSPVPLSWTYHSDVIKAARQSSDDISIYGFIASCNSAELQLFQVLPLRELLPRGHGCLQSVMLPQFCALQCVSFFECPSHRWLKPCYIFLGTNLTTSQPGL